MSLLTVGTCMESKKKNMMRSEIEAPSGRHMACSESRVCTPFLLALSPDDGESAKRAKSKRAWV